MTNMQAELDAMKAFCERVALEARQLGYRGAIVAVSVEVQDHSVFWVEASGPCLELEGLGRRVYCYVSQLWKGKTVSVPMAPRSLATGRAVAMGGPGGADVNYLFVPSGGSLGGGQSTNTYTPEPGAGGAGGSSGGPERSQSASCGSGTAQ